MCGLGYATLGTRLTIFGSRLSALEQKLVRLSRVSPTLDRHVWGSRGLSQERSECLSSQGGTVPLTTCAAQPAHETFSAQLSSRPAS